MKPLIEPTDKRGLALFEHVITKITESGFKTWNQSMWVRRAKGCGTVGCIFGHVASATAEPIFPSEGLLSSQPDYEYAQTVSFMDREGYVREVWEIATELLGLESSHANYISASNRSWGEIIAFRDAWRADEAGDTEVTTERDKIAHAGFLA